VGTWIPARINSALRAAPAWASDPDVGTESVRRWAGLGALIVVYAAVLGARALGRLVRGERRIVVLVLALAIPVASLEFRSHPGARTTDEPVSFGPAPASVTENEPAEGVNESPQENARMATWKRSVEQALTEAEAREQARPEAAATEEHGVDAAAARTIGAQGGQASRIDSGVVRELAKKQPETLSASNEDKAAAETKAASASGVAKEANAADDAKRASETEGSEQSSDSSPIAGGQDRQTASTGRVNGWNRRTEIFGAAEEADDREVARANAIARHALVYSWVTIDRAGHHWVHIRPLHYSQRE
jgi:hypothetical protein